MKRNAIARIIIYSILVIILTSALLIGIGIDSFISLPHSGTTVTGEAAIAPGNIQNLDIDWAAGSITIRRGDTDSIVISETGNFEEKYAMVYDVQGDTLSIDYSKSSVALRFGSQPSKNLTVTVPENWFCQSLDINGAALEIDVQDLDADAVSFDGAAVELTYTGTLNTLECDGASCVLKVTCNSAPTTFEVDGAACDVTLVLPEDCGFRAEMDGLGCSFNSNVEHKSHDGAYFYGDEHCKVQADGLGCALRIHYAPSESSTN